MCPASVATDARHTGLVCFLPVISATTQLILLLHYGEIRVRRIYKIGY
jgi:hypothetical protein